MRTVQALELLKPTASPSWSWPAVAAIVLTALVAPQALAIAAAIAAVTSMQAPRGTNCTGNPVPAGRV